MQSLLLSALASTALALPASNFVIPNLFMPKPLDDSFYNAPSGLDQMSNGQVYNSRAVDPDLEGKLSLASVSQVAYKTQDAYANSSHSVATIYKPLIPASDAKLLSYQVWEDSAELNCSPSYSLVKGLFSPDGPTAILDSAATIEFALLNGWYVVVPDHEGPNSTFLEGYNQGHCGLDGIRAALSFLDLDSKTPTAMYGYSGGASATVWMANLHDSYAPEINVAGVAHGGTPVDIRQTVDALDRVDNMFSGFIVGALAGILNGYPAVKEEIWPHFYQKLQNALTTMYTPDNCILSEVLTMGHTEWHTQMDVDFFAYPAVADVVSRESLLKNVSTGILSVPKFPRYIFHAETDQILPFAAVEQYVQEQCAAGADIEWVPWKGDDHVSIEYLGLPDVYRFLKQALNGGLPNVKCGTAPNDLLTLASTTLGDAIGQVVADILFAANGLTTPLGTVHFNPNQGYQA